MSIEKEVEELLKAKPEKKSPELSRLQQLIEEKRAKGVIPSKRGCLPNLQDAERHSRNILFKKGAS